MKTSSISPPPTSPASFQISLWLFQCASAPLPFWRGLKCLNFFSASRLFTCWSLFWKCPSAMTQPGCLSVCPSVAQRSLLPRNLPLSPSPLPRDSYQLSCCPVVFPCSPYQNCHYHFTIFFSFPVSSVPSTMQCSQRAPNRWGDRSRKFFLIPSYPESYSPLYTGIQILYCQKNI